MAYIKTGFNRLGVVASGAIIVGICVLPFFALAGCSKPEIKVEKEFVPVPAIVATGCIASSGRPVVVTPIKGKVSPDEWAQRAPGAKAQTVAAQAGERLNYEDKDRAATSGCR